MTKPDRKHHGGPDKAVLAYAASHYERWRRHPDLPGIGPGGFGENFTMSQQDEDKVCIGDIYQVGEAWIQVSQPRLPCWKLDRRWGVKGLARRVGDAGYQRLVPAGPGGRKGGGGAGDATWWNVPIPAGRSAR